MSHHGSRRRLHAARLALASACAALVLAPVPVPVAAAVSGPIPVPSPGNAALPQFIGAPATPHGFYAPGPPRHPFMAANGRSELHNDAYQSDTNQISGPLGNGMQVISAYLGGDCGSITFDRQGRIVAVCVGIPGPTLYMFDPHTLATLASMTLPPRNAGPQTLNIFQDFTGGGYFYLDNQDRVVVPTTSRHVYVIAESSGPSGPGFKLQHDYDLTSQIPNGDRLTSALPDWSGRIWVESFNGKLVTIDPSSGALHGLDLHEETENSFAVDETGAIYVVSIKALYRLQAGADGTPRVIWREVYPNSGIHKPGQVDAGSGTTPTVQGPYVTITDNADPLDIVVYKRAARVSGNRQVCVQPIFGKGAGADENSLIGAGNTMVAENNYGYTGPAVTQGGGRTAPGIERVDINADGRSCHVVWQNTTERVPTVVSKLSLASGLMYSYTKDDSSPMDPWYFTALDIRTGQVVYKQLAGTGFGYNNNYAPVTIGPDGSAYVGVISGLVELRDATPPRVPLATPPAGGPPRRFSCTRPSGRLGTRSLGPVTLGMTRPQARSRFLRSSTRGRRYMDFFCLRAIGIRVGYPSPVLLHSLSQPERRRVQGRVVLALSANPYYALRGVRAGARLTQVAGRLHIGPAFEIGSNTWYLAPNGPSRAVLKVRHGAIAEIGVADERLTSTRRAALRFLRSFS